MARTIDIPLADARALIVRAVDKAEEIGMHGAVAVIGATGALVSASRMDHGGAGGMARAKSKAWIAATQQIPSAEHLQRLRMIAPPMVTGFSSLSPEAAFPGAGGMPIRARAAGATAAGATADGAARGPVIAGIAASGAGIGPFVGYPGSEPLKLIADGGPSNGEDLLVHYALGIPYEGQHGDDLERWIAIYGEWPGALDPGAGTGMAAAPPACNQPEHRWALSLADAAIAAAAGRNLRVSVAIVDERGDPIQQDRMDGAATASVELAQALAATAAAFQISSAAVAERYGDTATRAELARALPFPILAVPGGIPIVDAANVVGGLGIAGPAPHLCAQVASAALDALAVG
jgi:uncharacterized protein GlcG (DUF336 family)